MAFPRLHKTFTTDRGRPYTDTPFVIPPGMLKSSQRIGDDPNLCMALNLTYKFVRYSCLTTTHPLSSTLARSCSEVFVIAGAGFGFLWWQGIIQPFLKELACYVTWQHYVGQGQGGLACRLRAIAQTATSSLVTAPRFTLD